MRRIVVLLLLLIPGTVLGLACAGGAPPPPELISNRRRADLISEEEIERARYANAYEVVQALRSNWLRERGPDSFTNPGRVLVYRDDIKMGGVEVLRMMPTAEISFIRFYDGLQASGRWGLDHGNGVIFVSTR